GGALEDPKQAVANKRQGGVVAPGQVIQGRSEPEGKGRGLRKQVFGVGLFLANGDGGRPGRKPGGIAGEAVPPVLPKPFGRPSPPRFSGIGRIGAIEEK